MVQWMSKIRPIHCEFPGSQMLVGPKVLDYNMLHIYGMTQMVQWITCCIFDALLHLTLQRKTSINFIFCVCKCIEAVL